MRRTYKVPMPYYAKHAAQKAAEKAALKARAEAAEKAAAQAAETREEREPEEAPPERRRPLLGRLDGVSEWSLVRAPDFLTALAGLSFPQLERWRKRNVDRSEANIIGTRAKVEVKVFDYATVRPKIGTFSHSLLAVICMLFASKDFKAPDPLTTLLVAFPLWDLAELMGYDLALRYPETVDAKGKTVMDERDYKRLKALFDEFRKDVKDAIDALWRIEVPVRFATTAMDIRGRKRLTKSKGRSRIISARGDVDGDCVLVEISPSMARCILQSPLRQIPTAALRLDARARTAYAISWAMAARYTDARNHDERACVAPDRLTVKTLLMYSALPMDNLDAILEKRAWKEKLKEPLERALEMLCGNWETRRAAETKPFPELGKETPGAKELADKVKKDLLVLESWEYVKPGGGKIEDRDAYFQSFYEWQEALVQFRFRNPPKIEPKKKRGRPRKESEPAAKELGE